MSRSLLAAALLAVFVVPAFAADVPLAGDRARLSDLRAQRRAQVISYSAAIDVSTLDPTVSGATLDLYSVARAEELTIALPATAWQGPLPGRRFRFTADGDPKMKILLVNGRLIRITLKGPGGFTLGGEPQESITARLTIGDARFCMVFGGVITKDDGTRFIARSAPPPASCPAAPNDNPPPFCVDKPDGTACDDGKACTAASRCFGGVCASEAPTCTGRLYDQNYCNLATGACATTPTACPPFAENDLCRPLDPLNVSTGACFYAPAPLCHPTGCHPQQCNPATGNCEDLPAEGCEAPDACTTPQFPDEPCFQGTCSAEHCAPDSQGIPNCNAVQIANCVAENTNSCFVPVSDDPPNASNGCVEGAGCVFTAIDCAQSQPLGPPGPCAEYYQDPTLPGCCNIRVTDCAAKFGNAAGYTYSCDGATNTCRATPQ